MNIKFYSIIKNLIENIGHLKILILIDDYFLNTPIEKNIDLSNEIKGYKNKVIKLISHIDDYYNENDKYDLIINLFFSSNFYDQIKFINKILSLSKLGTNYVSFLPFSGYVNHGIFNFNPLFYSNINKNKNFTFSEIYFTDIYGNQIKINKNYFDKIFYQTTERKNQSFIDQVYNSIKQNILDTSLVFNMEIANTKEIKLDYLKPNRLGHHLSGHGNVTSVDEGAFKTILNKIKVNSFLDIGCGPGGMVNYVNKLGIKAIGVDGDDSIIRIDRKSFYIHDFTQGKLNLNAIFDLGWSVEFLEHVEEKFSENYFDTFKKCKYIFCTFAPEGKGGYHHVNTKNKKYWLDIFQKNGFKFNSELTEIIKKNSTIRKNFVRENGLFFINEKFEN